MCQIQSCWRSTSNQSIAILGMEIRDISSSHTIQIMPSYEMLEVIVGSNLPLDLKMFCVSTHQSMFSFDAKDLPLTSIVRPPKARNELLAEHWIALLHWIRSSLGHGVAISERVSPCSLLGNGWCTHRTRPVEAQ